MLNPSSVPPREKRNDKEPCFFFCWMQINFQIFYASAAFTVDPGVEVNCRGKTILENSICFSATVVIQCVSRNTPGNSVSPLLQPTLSASFSFSTPSLFRAFLPLFPLFYFSAFALSLLFTTLQSYWIWFSFSNTYSIYCITLPSLSQHIVLSWFVSLLPSPVPVPIVRLS